MEKRFLAPLWVFIFGMARSFGAEDHRHRLAFHLRVTLDLGDIRQLGCDSRDDFPTALGVGDLSSAQHQGHLDLVSLSQEPPRVAGSWVRVRIAGPPAGLSPLWLEYGLSPFS